MANWSCDSAAMGIPKKAFAKSSTSWNNPAQWPKYLRWWQCWTQCYGWGTLICSILGSPWPFAMGLWLFYWPYWTIENTLNRAHDYLLAAVLGKFLLFLGLPGTLYRLTATTPEVDGWLTGSQLAFLLISSFDYSDLEAEFTHGGAQSLIFQDINANMFSDIEEIKTSYSLRGECPVCSVKENLLTITLLPTWWC